MKIPKFIMFLFIADVVLVILYIAHFTGWGSLHSLIGRFIDLDGEKNLPTWYQSMQLSGIASLFSIFAYHKFERNKLVSWVLLLLPITFFILSLDEVAGIHEWLGRKSDVLLPGENRINTMFSTTGIWMFIIGIPFISYMASLIYIIIKNRVISPDIVKKFVMGLCIFLMGALGIEILSNFFQNNTAAYVFQVSLEELGEMIGGTIMLWAAYDLLLSSGLLFAIRNNDAKTPELEVTF